MLTSSLRLLDDELGTGRQLGTCLPEILLVTLLAMQRYALLCCLPTRCSFLRFNVFVASRRFFVLRLGRLIAATWFFEIGSLSDTFVVGSCYGFLSRLLIVFRVRFSV
jgi:hypothetical protein